MLKRAAIALVWLASISCSGSSNSGAPEKPWSRASWDDPVGWYTVQMKRGDGMSVRGEVPPGIRYSPGPRGYITTRNAKLVSVSVPAGDFLAARMWSAETIDGRRHELDEWVVPDLPVRVQAWSRPSNATELYDPPADAVIPLGNSYSRLVRIERK